MRQARHDVRLKSLNLRAERLIVLILTRWYFYKRLTMLKTLPRRGYDAQTILHTMNNLRQGDAQWQEGKCWALVYHVDQEVTTLLKEAYGMFLSENALNPAAFPSIKQMETEVVAMAAHLLGGDEHTCGSFTTGGTESILMAVKTARQWAKKHRRWIKQPEIVLPESAHPAFEKAAYYFGMKIVHVPVGEDFKVDLKAMKRAITHRTVMLVGSAPSYPQGVVDDIPKIAAMAQRKKILCHVDSCIGGFVLPFAQELGYPITPWNFQVPGVTSISVDLHKYAYAAKPASLVLYKDAELRKLQFFAYTEWSGGIYVSPTMTGSRSGGAVAAAWAVLNHLGHEGYLDIVRQVMGVRDQLVEGIAKIDGIHVVGKPESSLISIASDTIDVFELGDLLNELGWHFDRQQAPQSLHLTINMSHVNSYELFLKELGQCVAQCTQRSSKDKLKERVFYGTLNAAVKLLPSPLISKATAVASKAMGVGQGGELPKKSAAMYGMMAQLPNRGDVHALVIDALDQLLRYQPDKEIKLEAPAPKAQDDASPVIELHKNAK